MHPPKQKQIIHNQKLLAEAPLALPLFFRTSMECASLDY